MSRLSWLRDQVVQRQLAAVERVVARAAYRGSRCPPFHRQLFSPQSKRLRPALLLLCARLGQQAPAADVVATAAGVELLHEATLHHDDIVDEADLRRGEPTAQRVCGPMVAAFAGSELLYATVELFAHLPTALRRCIGRTGHALCRGQLRELETSGNPDVSLCERVRIMRDKTARLFALAAHLGAELGGADRELVRAADQFGLHFGLCFQLADDIRDIIEEPAALGRHPGSDLSDGIYTIPILLALQDDTATGNALREVLIAHYAAPDPGLLKEGFALLRSTRAIERSQGIFASWMELTRRDLELVARRCGPGAADSLADLVQYLGKESGVVGSREDRLNTDWCRLNV